MAWGQTELKVWPEDYALLRFPPACRAQVLEILKQQARAGFSLFLEESEEISLLVPFESAARYAGASMETSDPLRVITFDTKLPMDLCGFFAPAAERLALAGISILPWAGFRTDHLGVPAEQFEAAVNVLRDWIAFCRV